MAGAACACALLAWVAGAASACGSPLGGGLPFGGPPSAASILGRPAASGLKDAHLTMTGTPGQGVANVQLQGDGDAVFSPRLAYHLAVTTNNGAVKRSDEVLSVNGVSYQRPAGGRWLPGPAQIVPAAVSAWSGATEGRYIGEETVNGARCWHVAASAGGDLVDLWVRQADGFPVRSQLGRLVVDYSKFNRGLTIVPPAAAAIQPQPKAAAVPVGAVAHLSGVDVVVSAVTANYKPANKNLRPRAGARFVLVDLTYTLTGADRVSYGPFQWRLGDAGNASYQPAFLDRDPKLGIGDLTAGGQKVRGFLG